MMDRGREMRFVPLRFDPVSRESEPEEQGTGEVAA